MNLREMPDRAMELGVLGLPMRHLAPMRFSVQRSTFNDRHGPGVGKHVVISRGSPPLAFRTPDSRCSYGGFTIRLCRPTC